MKQNNKKTLNNDKNISNISHPDYDPAKDPEVGPDTITEALIEWRNGLPYNKKRYIMIVGFAILIILIVYLGYARGALDVCNDLGGRLGINLFEVKCHPSQYTQQNLPINNIVMTPIENGK